MKLFSNEIIRRQISCTHKEFARFNLALHKGTRSVVGPGLLSENQHVSPSVRPPSLSIWSDGNARRAGLFPSTLLYFLFLLFNLNSDSLRWVAPQLFRSPCGGYKLKTGTRAPGHRVVDGGPNQLGRLGGRSVYLCYVGSVLGPSWVPETKGKICIVT